MSAEIARRCTSIIANIADCEPLTIVYLMFFACFAYGRASTVNIRETPTTASVHTICAVEHAR